MKLQFKKVRDVKSPNRGTKGSAGIDFYIPNDYLLADKELVPGESVLIPSGIKVKIPENYALIAFNKSGVAVKQGLSVGASVIDSDYEGEIHFHLINTSNVNKVITPGQKIVQFLLMPVNHNDIEEVDELIYDKGERGSGGFGSTGIK